MNSFSFEHAFVLKGYKNATVSSYIHLKYTLWLFLWFLSNVDFNLITSRELVYFLMQSWLSLPPFPPPPSLFCMFRSPLSLLTFQHFEWGRWKTEPTNKLWSNSSAGQACFVLFLARADVALVDFEEQYLSGKKKLLRLGLKWCKSFICKQIMNWEPCGKKTRLRFS